MQAEDFKSSHTDLHAWSIAGWLCGIEDYRKDHTKTRNIWVKYPEEDYIHIVSGERYDSIDNSPWTWEINEKLPVDSMSARVIMGLALQLDRVSKELQDLQWKINELCSDYHGE